MTGGNREAVCCEKITLRQQHGMEAGRLRQSNQALSANARAWRCHAGGAVEQRGGKDLRDPGKNA